MTLPPLCSRQLILEADFHFIATPRPLVLRGRAFMPIVPLFLANPEARAFGGFLILFSFRCSDSNHRFRRLPSGDLSLLCDLLRGAHSLRRFENFCSRGQNAHVGLCLPSGFLGRRDRGITPIGFPSASLHLTALPAGAGGGVAACLGTCVTGTTVLLPRPHRGHLGRHPQRRSRTTVAPYRFRPPRKTHE